MVLMRRSVFPQDQGCNCSCRNWSLEVYFEERGEREKLFLTNVCGSLQIRKVLQKIVNSPI